MGSIKGSFVNAGMGPVGLRATVSGAPLTMWGH